MAKIMTVRPPDELKTDLQQCAKKLGIPLNSLIIQILWDWVKNNKTFLKGAHLNDL